jgi:RNase H-fold protein (predicted Holliday junction resolvase)
MDCVLAIDPGSSKCGIAVVSKIKGVLARTIVPLDALSDTVTLFKARFSPEAVIVGKGTGAFGVLQTLKSLDISVYTVDEKQTTEKARARYFADYPPTGWRRLIPKGLLVPPEPYDDYAAVLIAESFLNDAEKSQQISG